MFTGSRDDVLHALKQLGAQQCGYCTDPARWLDTRCDCKYGAKAVGPNTFGGEQTGCPELRTLHLLVSSMSERQWDDWRREQFRSDSVQAQQARDRAVRDAQAELRTGPRSYTEAQAAMISEQVARRQPLAESPLPLDET